MSKPSNQPDAQLPSDDEHTDDEESNSERDPAARRKALIDACDELPEGPHKETIQERARGDAYSATDKGIKQLIEDLEEFFGGDEQAEIMLAYAEQGFFLHRPPSPPAMSQKRQRTLTGGIAVDPTIEKPIEQPVEKPTIVILCVTSGDGKIMLTMTSNPSEATGTSTFFSFDMQDMTTPRAYLYGLVHVLCTTTGPLVIKSQSEYVVNGFNCDMATWIRCGWVTKTGSPVKHKDLWLLVLALRKDRKVTVALA